MTTTRRLACDDLFRLAPTNLDVLTETYNLSFYALYLSRWPDLATLQECARGRVAAYVIGKAEGRGREWHGHVSAVTVAPEFRRLGLASALCGDLERVSDRTYRGVFVDLFVRVSNTVAINMYRKMGYAVYRRVLKYYDGQEDGFDMRKPLARDRDRPEGTPSACVPLDRPVTTKELMASR